MTTDAFDLTAEAGGGRDREVLVAGMQLGKYKLERILGEGGMGVVWAAHDPDLERSIAIKLLRNAHADADQRARLLREARAMARLKHPNVLTVYEVDSEGDRDYIAMELVDGTSLFAWLATKPPHDEVFRAIVAAGRGLAAAHAADLVHRDFKPHNVLRSHDGRVLVTDFGLARGFGDTLAEHAHATAPPPGSPLDVTVEATPPPRKSDAVLDSTLTQPGALMGTPAYMAPEQYLGASPDPRTDQFAFCVSAWQALAGERPFRGTTIGELKTQCAAGVTGVDAKLPRAVRAVLARGLSPAPEDRWPSLDALLDALEAAGRAPRRRRTRIYAGFGLVMAGILAVSLLRPCGQRVVTTPSSCEPRDHAFAEVWTTARRRAFDQRFTGSPNAIAVADALDHYRDAWLDRYAAACKAGSSAKATARISCLRGERDDVDGFIRLSESMPASAMEGLDLWGVIPSLEVCDSDSPVAPPLLPEDRVKRDEIARLRAETAKRRLDENDLLAHADEPVARARKIGWKPLVPEVEVMVGTAAQLLGRADQARALFENAAEEAERVTAFKIEAMARIALLEVESLGTFDPTDPDRAQQLIDKARGAVELAGNDPALRYSLDNLVASIDMWHGKLDAAIDTLESTRTKLLAAHAFARATVAMREEIDALELRDHAGDLDLAWQRGLDTERAIAASHRIVPHSGFPYALEHVAWWRGDLDEAHARADQVHPGDDRDLVPLHGHVIGPDGRPAANALVIAWHDRLVSDGSRLYTRPHFNTQLARTDASGAFTVSGRANGAVVAELGELRSAPVVIHDAAAISLVLAPTHAIAGTVDTSSTATLDAFVRIAVGTEATWTIHAPVARDRTFRLGRLPAVAAVVGVAGRGIARESKDVIGGPARDGVKLRWPGGAAIDVIAMRRGQVWVFRGHTIPTSRGESERRARTDHDVAQRDLVPVGFRDATTTGRASYTKGAVHALIDDNAPGDVTICEMASDGPPICVATTLATSTRLAPGVIVLPTLR